MKPFAESIRLSPKTTKSIGKNGFHLCSYALPVESLADCRFHHPLPRAQVDLKSVIELHRCNDLPGWRPCFMAPGGSWVAHCEIHIMPILPRRISPPPLLKVSGSRRQCVCSGLPGR